MSVSLNNWTIGRRIAAGFVALGIVGGVMVATFEYGITQLETRHEEARIDSEAALDAVEAAASGAELYQIVADAQINIELDQTKVDWPAMRKVADERLARVARVVHTPEHQSLLAESRTHYDAMAALFEQKMLPKLEKERRSSEATRQLDGAIDEEAAGMAAGLRKIAAAFREQSESAASQFTAQKASTNRIALLVVVVGLGIGIGLGTLVVTGVSRRLGAAVDSLTEGSRQVVSASDQVSGSAQSLSQGATEQAASLQETSASMEEMASMTRRNSESTRQAVSLVADVHSKVDGSQQALEDMVRSMAAIQDSSQRVSKIIRTIDEIAFQTNILALNAAVEAARAGEAGMGFAVVADEVRNLAQRSAQAAKDTAGLIEESIAKAQEGNTKVGEVTQAVAGISESVNRVKGLVQEVSEASVQQTQGFDQVALALSQMEKVTQGTAATAEESAAASEELNAQASTTMEVVDQLRALVGAGNRTSGAANQQPAPKAKGGLGSLLRMPTRSIPSPSQAEQDEFPLAKTGTFGSF